MDFFMDWIAPFLALGALIFLILLLFYLTDYEAAKRREYNKMVKKQYKAEQEIERQKKEQDMKEFGQPVGPFTREGIKRGNRLYMCSCNKYSRKYQQEVAYLQMKLQGQEPPEKVLSLDRNDINMWRIKYHHLREQGWSIEELRDEPSMKERICPHCQEVDGLELSDDDWPWLAVHPDCPALDAESVLSFGKLKEQLKQDIYDMGSMKAFQEYNGLPVTLEEAADNLAKWNDRIRKAGDSDGTK